VRARARVRVISVNGSPLTALLSYF